MKVLTGARRLGMLVSGPALILVGAAASVLDDKPYVIRSEQHLLRDVTPVVAALPDTIRAIVEIPAFTRQKWEVDTESGDLMWEFKDGKPRVMKYGLPYLANYGMVPQTMMAEHRGGDGDPLDVVILGEPHERGAVVQTRVIGLMNMIDDGEADHKIIGVRLDDPLFSDVKSVEDLEASMPGVLDILRIWFKNYKLEPSEIQIIGFEPKDRALAMVGAAHEDYEHQARER